MFGKKMTAVLSAAVMLCSAAALPPVRASAEAEVVSYMLEYGYDRSNAIEKELDIYFLEDGIKALGYSVPSNLPTQAVIPEWDDCTWSTSGLFYLDRESFKNGVIVPGERATKRVFKAIRDSSDYTLESFYGVTEDRQLIHYKVRLHNYAFALREQAVKQWIKDNITAGMTTKEKVEAVLRKTTYGAYDGGVDVVLGTSSGDCIDYSIDAMYYFNGLGIPARMRYDGYRLWGGEIVNIPNHHNLWVMIDGDLYEAEPTPSGGKTEEGYLSNLTSNLIKVSGNTSWMMTDGQCVYYKQSDGTLAIVDLIEFNGKFPEKWTVPASTVIEGKEYKVTKFVFNGYTATTYYDTPDIREIVLPKGVSLQEKELRIIGDGCFENLSRVTLNEDIHTLDGIDADVVVDASMTSIDTYTDASEQQISIYKFMLGGSTVYAGSVSDEVKAAHDADVSNHNYWTLIDMSDPTAHDLTIKISGTDNGSLTLRNGKCGIKPFSSENGSYYFPKLPQGTYTATYKNEYGEEKEIPVTVSGKDQVFSITPSMLYSLKAEIDSYYYIDTDTQKAGVITDKKGNAYKTEYASYRTLKADGLPDGTYELFLKLPGYPASSATVTVKEGRPAKDPYTFRLFRYGDVNSDDSVSMKDLTLLQRRINGWDVEVNSTASDINSDGSLTMKDLVYLQKLINGAELELA